MARLNLAGDALIANWRDFAAAVGPAACGAAIKADGYGLGARAVLLRLAAAGCRQFYVAHWHEVPPLLPLPDGVTISVLHGVTPAELPAALQLPAEPVLMTVSQAALWRQTGRPAQAMIDTGMNRLGLAPGDAAQALAGIEIGVLHSHLACADQPGHAMNAAQHADFVAAAAAIPAQARALANSAGVALGRAYHFDLVRPGIGLFGGGLLPDGRPSRPVASLAAPILQIRDVPAGASVGYGATFMAARPSRIATLALGYADGYARGLSNAGWALAAARDGPGDGPGDGPRDGLGDNRVRCPAAGRVSMDLSSFDVTDAPGLTEGDWLDVPFDPELMAAASGRTSYELLVALGQRFDRVWA